MDQQQFQPVGIREGAKLLGVSHSTISRQVKAGIIPNRGTVENPLIDVEEARLARAHGLDQSKQRGPEAPLNQTAPAAKPVAEELGPTYATARTRREEALASTAEIELAERRGLLLDKGEVVDAFFTIATQMREALDQVAVEVGAQFGPTIGAAVNDKLRRVLTKIAEDFERFASPAPVQEAATPAEQPEPADAG